MSSSIDFYLKQLAPLVGGTITALAPTGTSDDPFDEPAIARPEAHIVAPGTQHRERGAPGSGAEHRNACPDGGRLRRQ